MRVNPIAFSPVEGEARMKSRPTTVDEMSHVVAARNWGEKRANEAARSFSAAARVANPNRVNRKYAHKAEPRSTVMSVSQSRSRGMEIPLNLKVLSGRMGSTRLGVASKFKTTKA